MFLLAVGILVVPLIPVVWIAKRRADALGKQMREFAGLLEGGALSGHGARGRLEGRSLTLRLDPLVLQERTPVNARLVCSLDLERPLVSFEVKIPGLLGEAAQGLGLASGAKTGHPELDEFTWSGDAPVLKRAFSNEEAVERLLRLLRERGIQRVYSEGTQIVAEQRKERMAEFRAWRAHALALDLLGLGKLLTA